MKRLGLFHVAQLANINVDIALMTALIERWRPETNTFHLPVGEMTVTLGDVSCLWGLPIQGEAVTAYSDDEWSMIIYDCLEVEPINEEMVSLMKKSVKSGESHWSTYHISLPRLRELFHILPPDSPDYVIDRHTRAYCLDLFGSLIFPDQSSDGVPAFFLQFLEDLQNPKEYNWGAATLGMLYRELSRASMAKARSIAGPISLLQIWC